MQNAEPTGVGAARQRDFGVRGFGVSDDRALPDHFDMRGPAGAAGRLRGGYDSTVSENTARYSLPGSTNVSDGPPATSALVGAVIGSKQMSASPTGA